MIYFIIFYLLSCLLQWNTTRLLYKYNWKILNPNTIDVILVFIPLFNTIMGIISLFIVDFPKKNKDRSVFIDKFFRIKT